MPASYAELIALRSGTSPINTNQRLGSVLSSSHQKFPPIPATSDEFVSMGLNQRPTLFGCDPTSTSNPEYPLVLYLPNGPPLAGAKPVTKYVGLATLRTHPDRHPIVLTHSSSPILRATPTCSWTKSTRTLSVASSQIRIHRIQIGPNVSNVLPWTEEG